MLVDVGMELNAKQHLEYALKYLVEGKSLTDKDPVQASEKLYEVAGEVVKAFTVHFNLTDIIKRVDERGRWTATELEKAVLRISGKLGEWFFDSWDKAWALHVWGFHEAKFDTEDVKRRLPAIEKMISEAQKIIREQQ
ncbi:PaREP1 family protein [Candidatus Culexarchaeum yellowstonense]|uniref:PaREP1 family protein n=1 Tax=Candidatus Culexarchaeum yellowstonense TaxID=2928963 RepID=UPI0026ECD164|nr:PaREP1 family protein [Candidatus Culexarchaeum yellowstonense]